MHYINGSYTTYINKKIDRSGHIFQGRYKAILIEKDNYLMQLSRYIHLNPVKVISIRYFCNLINRAKTYLKLDKTNLVRLGHYLESPG
jgi:hypothetical protein